jgi:hypothetical protein
LDVITACDLALCQTKEPFPMLKISAAILVAKATADTFDFFRSVKINILSDFMLEGPIWGIDQIALYKTACELKSAGKNFFDINALIKAPSPLPDLFVKKEDGTIPLDKRRAVRSTAFYQFAGITNDCRLLWRIPQ